MTLRLSALVAVAKNGVIGRKNTLPWRLPPDLKRFKMLTMGHSLIMGRKTYESIGRPLPGRNCIVITHQAGRKIPGAIVVNSIAEALKACINSQGNGHTDATRDTECFVIGGAEILRQMLPQCNRMYLTEIQREFDGDVVFPEFEPDDWAETLREKHRWDDDGLEYHFVVLDRKRDAV